MVILAARALLLDARSWIDGGGLLIERGVVRAVLRSMAAVRRRRSRASPLIDLGDLVLTPGLVDAHAHLDLGMLRGRVTPATSFAGWIRSVMRGRGRLARRDLERGVRTGARALLASGTTAVGDIDASGTTARLARTLGLRVRVYREVLDAWDPARTAPVLAALRARLPAGGRVHPGVSPHAPYTTSAELLAGVRGALRRRSLALAIHWAETREEGEWLEAGTGPLSALLPESPHRAGLELLDAAGLLTSRTALVHGNHARADELALLARRRIALVHCPGTHAFFGRAPFPFRRYRAAGIPLAIGTDSLASNAVLDMRREMALVRSSAPGVPPAEVFAMATEGGARALALPAIGHARPGAAADLVAWRLAARTRAGALDELTAALPPVEHVFLDGRRSGSAVHWRSVDSTDPPRPRAGARARAPALR